MNTNLKRIGDPDRSELHISRSGRKSYKDSVLMDIKLTIYSSYRDIKRVIVRDIPQYLKNIFYWNRIIYRTRYWDYGYLLDMEEKYLSIMLKRYEFRDYIENQWELTRDIKLMIKLLSLLKYDEEYDNRLINISNSHRFLNRYWDDKDKNSWLFKVTLRDEKLWRTYCLVRERTLRLLWD